MKILIKNIQSFHDSSLLADSKPDFIDTIRWEKIQALKNEADKLRSLASGYLLDEMCREMQISKPLYKYGEKGKPYIEGHENFAFNISHSGDYAVLVYCGGSNVLKSPEAFEMSTDYALPQAFGIDIQQIRFMREGMIKRILHEKEMLPAGLSLEEENQYLNRIWSIKESYVKMTGEGLALDFRKIFIDFEKGIVSAKNCEKAYFCEYHGLTGYALSICSNKPFFADIKECVHLIE